MSYTNALFCGWFICDNKCELFWSWSQIMLSKKFFFLAFCWPRYLGNKRSVNSHGMFLVKRHIYIFVGYVVGLRHKCHFISWFPCVLSDLVKVTDDRCILYIFPLFPATVNKKKRCLCGQVNGSEILACVFFTEFCEFCDLFVWKKSCVDEKVI